MKRKKMEKEVVHLLEWIIEYPGVWQIVCNPDGKETSPESFKMAYDMLVKKSLFYLIPVLLSLIHIQMCIRDSFYRSKSVREQEGVGIGLYLARQIISGEGGYIKVDVYKRQE